jgi:ribulose kinase
MSFDPADVVVGGDVGTLPGRAVVVRVADGAEPGTAVHEYQHAVPTDALPDGTAYVGRGGNKVMRNPRAMKRRQAVAR